MLVSIVIPPRENASNVLSARGVRNQFFIPVRIEEQIMQRGDLFFLYSKSKYLTSDLSFTIIFERKITLLCMEVVMANDTKERIPVVISCINC